jgi:molybdopterin-containing oxidoreductase family iron-sulfur binding subunit
VIQEVSYSAQQVDIKPAAADAIDICFALDPSVYDGRFANNAWLQECPDPVTKLTWDNAALLSPALARKLSVETGDLIRIDVNNTSLQAPVYVIPGQADNAITLPLGYGRSSGGSIAEGAGVNAYTLRTTQSLGFASGAKVTKIAGHYPLATTQEHWAFDLDKHFASVSDEQAKERAIIREATPEELAGDAQAIKKQGEHAPIHLNVYTAPALTGANQWGMAVDLNACVGCNACVIACQSENNVPVVGKDEVIRGREMHWMRLDRYFAGDGEDDVKATLQPMMCQQCENAPCEPVCPVNATVHSPEGLNEMVYNRCIGTRYCSNNCPYKVRRFNYFDWNKGTLVEQIAPTRDGQIQPVPTEGWSRPQVMQPPMQQTFQMQKNPNVTVRMRGVMEKCTYCVQRIEAAKITARAAVGQGQAPLVDGKPEIRVADGAVTSACAQACPTQAITFGDIADPTSRVSKLHASNRSYQVLEHLNVRPRTQYLAKVRNLNPKLVEAAPKQEHE